METIFALLPTMLAPSHLDLHSLNILFKEESFCLVDWVNGGISDAHFDLATFSVFHNLTKEQQIVFLSQYFGRAPTDYEWNRFVVTQPVRLFVIAAALIVSSTDESLDDFDHTSRLPSLEDFSKHGIIWPHRLLGMSMLNAGLALIDDDHFKASFAYLNKISCS